jgi:hypothetical protein
LAGNCEKILGLQQVRGKILILDELGVWGGIGSDELQDESLILRGPGKGKLNMEREKAVEMVMVEGNPERDGVVPARDRPLDDSASLSIGAKALG